MSATDYPGMSPELVDDLSRWRRHIHAEPELSYEEHATTDYIAAELEQMGLTVQRFELGTGLFCDVPAAEDASATDVVALRADIDALPMTEESGEEFASGKDEVAHTCGHDAHTAMLLGAARMLVDTPPPRPVRLIFQPAEETMPGGALDCVREGVVEGIDRIIALHCDPHREVGELGVCAGPITSSNAKINVEVRSTGGHTARPHETQDTVFALAQIATGTIGSLGRRVDPRSATVLTWGAIHAGGSAPNVIPSKGSLLGTVRSADRDTWAILPDVVPDIIRNLAVPLGIDVEVDFTQGVPPVVNDATCAELAAEAIREILGEDGVGEAEQSSGGEDFAWYCEEIPGIYLRLGVWDGEGEESDLHHPGFRMDERALAIGAAVFDRFARLDRPSE